MITLENVNKIYSNGLHAVKDVNLKVNEGDIFGIIGLSGAGKSSLIRLINRLEEPTSGRIFINGEDILSLNKTQLLERRKKIGMIFQHFNLLWSRTVLENITFPLEIAHVPKNERIEKAKKLAELVGLGDRLHAYPNQLSGGQKQRVGIARALANDPEILISDEATSALDPQTTEEVLDLLEDINRKLNLTIVIITHEMHVIRRLADKVAVMETGKVIEEGPVSEVFTHPQQDLTKRFVNAEVDTNNTPDVKEVVNQLLEKYPHGQLVELRFHGDQVQLPVVSELVRQFPEVQLSILEGSIHQLADKARTIGTLFVQLVGSDEDIQEALKFLETLRVEVRVISNE